MCVSPLTSSGPRKTAEDSREFQYPAGIKPMLPCSLLHALTFKPKVFINLWGKMAYILSYLATLNRFFHELIAQAEYRGQTRYTRILDSKPLVDIFLFASVLAQFSSNS